MCPDCTLSWTTHAHTQILSSLQVCERRPEGDGEQIPSCSTTSPSLHPEDSPVCTATARHTTLPPPLLLQGVGLSEGFVAPRQQTFLLQLVHLQHSLWLASIQGSNCPMCWLNGSYMCTHIHKGTHAYIYI